MEAGRYCNRWWRWDARCVNWKLHVFVMILECMSFIVSTVEMLRFLGGAYTERGNLSDDEQRFLSEYCRQHSCDPQFPMITNVRLHEIV